MPVEFKDYYHVLGVSRTASEDEIRKSFRKLARQYHPDVAKNKAAAEERFKEINEAYEVLSDPEKRRKYDRLGANWKHAGGFEPPPGWEALGGSRRRKPGAEAGFRFSGTGFSDFFEQFFGGRSRGFDASPGFDLNADDEPSPRRQGRARRGNDIEGDILVNLEEVVKGAVRVITLRQVNPGTGAAEQRDLRVRIPAGVQAGQLIRVAGKGETGSGGGDAGDLYLRVRFARHPEFEVRGADIYHELDLAPWEAVLGATAKVPTLEGSVSLRIPPGTAQGQHLRVRGRGLPVRGGSNGDLHAVVQIQVPPNSSEEEKAIWGQLARRSRFNPRHSEP